MRSIRAFLVDVHGVLSAIPTPMPHVNFASLNIFYHSHLTSLCLFNSDWQVFGYNSSAKPKTGLEGLIARAPNPCACARTVRTRVCIRAVGRCRSVSVGHSVGRTHTKIKRLKMEY